MKSPHRSSFFLDAHHCFFIECLLALLLFFLLAGRISLLNQIIASWDLFAFTGIILSWITILRHDPYEVQRRVLVNDPTRKFLFAIVLLASIASFSVTWLLLTATKGASSLEVSRNIILGITTVFLSWFLVHTRFAIQYAFLFYAEAPEKERSQISQGLIFPGKKMPDYLDFAYFSFVIGMTFQVSDVQVAEYRLRRFVLLHGLISFFFNTSILALIVNIVAGLG
ncbi:MAG: DUF1345 domain-containing protein [Verrucomicrobia bacterium]|nr:MAG: DUF1345 domain-containing protein [Verrucomicrobiota bacterium]